MRILLLNDYYHGGGAEGVFRTTIDLLKRDNEVEFLCGAEKIISPKNLKNYLWNKEFMILLKRKLEEFNPDIVHIHNYYHFLSPGIFTILRRYKKKKHLKVVFTAHDYHLISPSTSLFYYENDKIQPINTDEISFIKVLFKKIDHRGLKYNLVKKLYWLWSIKIHNVSKTIDTIITPSYFLKETFLKNKVKHKINIVRNPFVDVKTLKNTFVKTPTQEKINLVYIGRLSKEKGILELLNTLVLNKVNNFTFDILGTGEQEFAIKSYIKNNKLSFVKTHGYQKEDIVKEFLLKSNVLVLPSLWYENAPLSIIEGASYGNIILSSNLGGVKELTKLTKNYVLVNDWGKEIKSALEKIKNMGSNCVLKPEAFDNEAYLIQLENIYKTL